MVPQKGGTLLLFIAGLPPLPDLTGVPEFAAGLLYGLTGNNHLDEIKVCMEDVDPLLQDAKIVLDDIKHLKFIKAGEEVGQIIWDLPDAFTSCTGMDDDIAAIEEWAEIFKQPIKLSKIVSKNWLLHGVEIKEQITNGKTAFDSGEYFDAGEDAANAIVDLVGPIKDSSFLH